MNYYFTLPTGYAGFGDVTEHAYIRAYGIYSLIMGPKKYVHSPFTSGHLSNKIAKDVHYFFGFDSLPSISSPKFKNYKIIELDTWRLLRNYPTYSDAYKRLTKRYGDQNIIFTPLRRKGKYRLEYRMMVNAQNITNETNGILKPHNALDFKKIFKAGKKFRERFKIKPVFTSTDKIKIGVHIRLGDVSLIEFQKKFWYRLNSTPVLSKDEIEKRYSDTEEIKKLRKKLRNIITEKGGEKNVEIVVFSDGHILPESLKKHLKSMGKSKKDIEALRDKYDQDMIKIFDEFKNIKFIVGIKYHHFFQSVWTIMDADILFKTPSSFLKGVLRFTDKILIEQKQGILRFIDK